MTPDVTPDVACEATAELFSAIALQAAVRPSDQPPPDPAVMQGAIRDPLVLTGREALEVIVDRLDS